MNILAYAGCVHQFQINENGCLQIDIYGYDHNTERFLKVIDKPLMPSMTMKANKCMIVGSCLIDKGLGVLLHIIPSNSSTILMFIQLQSRPWLCNIVYTLSIPSSNYGKMKFLGINSLISIFINEEKYSNGFYIIDNNKQIYQRNIQFIQCSLLTYIYCYLKENYYWLMGTQIDLNTQRKSIKVYYGCSTSLSTPLIPFDTIKFIPLSLVDNIEDIYIINHKLQLNPRLILGDVILSSQDHRILTCHNGIISHELRMNNLINSIHSYSTIENEELVLFIKKDIQTIEIYQYHENLTLTPYTTTNEQSDFILTDDFTKIGWTQILFLKNDFNPNSFILTDFSQIHIYQQESDYDYHIDEKHMSIDMDDVDIQTSLVLAQNILRKKIINADYLVNEGYFQCKQIENDIRKLTNKHHISDLNIQIDLDNLQQNSVIQLIDTNWFIYQTNLFLHVIIKNLSNDALTSVYLFGIEKNSNKMKTFNLKTSSESLLNEQTSFKINPKSCLTLILTTLIELDKDMDLELYLLINDNNKLYHIGSIHITIDDLINPNNKHLLKLNALETQSMNDVMYQQALIYLNTLFRLSINIESMSKFDFLQGFQQLLITLDFKSILNQSNIYLRINEGNIFEHILIHFDENNQDLIVHVHAKNSNEVLMLMKYMLSKLDFQSFSLINSKDCLLKQDDDSIKNRIDLELKSYLDLLKQIPTIMRKVAPTSKSESYRLLKFENFQSFQNASHLTDLLLASSIID